MVNKKGISPLIATVLLIGFTIVLAALVIRWGADLFQGQIKTQTCENEGILKCTGDVDFQITRADYDASPTAGEELKISLVNNGAEPIDKVIVRIRENNGEVVAIDNVVINPELEAYESLQNFNVDVDPVIPAANLNGCADGLCPISIIPKITHTTNKGDQCIVVCRNEVSKQLDSAVA